MSVYLALFAEFASIAGRGPEQRTKQASVIMATQGFKKRIYKVKVKTYIVLKQGIETRKETGN